TIAPTRTDQSSPTFLSFGQGLPLAASKLGGPKPKPKKTAAGTTKINLAPLFRGFDRRRSRFLKAAHLTACKHFGTVLGPEFDLTHRNHFHVDLARRRRGAFCR
ncbi:MAG: extensin family protein, partial [Pseudomonadota bacterium]